MTFEVSLTRNQKDEQTAASISFSFFLLYDMSPFPLHISLTTGGGKGWSLHPKAIKATEAYVIILATITRWGKENRAKEVVSFL